MNEQNKKEGVSVKELESYAKNNRFEIFFCILFVLATLFTLVFWGATIAIFFAGIGAIIGVLLSAKIDQFAHKMAAIIFSKEGSTQFIIGILALVIAIFLAPLIFLVLGLHAGKSMIRLAKKSAGNAPKEL